MFERQSEWFLRYPIRVRAPGRVVALADAGKALYDLLQ